MPSTANSRAASVRTIPRPWRSTSVVRVSRSSLASCCDTADGVYPSTSAARLTEPY